MRKCGVLLLAVVFLFATVAPAAAHGPHVVFWPFLAPLYLPFAVAATVTAGVAAVATGVATAVTAPFIYASAPPPPVYAPPAAYSAASVYPPAAYAPPAPAYPQPGYGYAPPASAYPQSSYGYAPPSPAYPRPAYVPPPAYPVPPTYSQTISTASAARTTSYRYYCPSARSYFPNVTACSGGWLTVVPQ